MGVESEQCLYSNVQNVVMPNGITKDLRIDISGYGKPTSVGNLCHVLLFYFYDWILSDNGLESSILQG